MRKIIVTLLLASSLAMAQTGAGDDSFASAASYFALQGADAGLERSSYGAAIEALSKQFAALCGDSFCAGDYATLTPIEWSCSVSRSGLKIGECRWTFAGSATVIDRHSGALRDNARMYHCPIPITGTAADLSAFLAAAQDGGASGADGLRGIKLPGSGRTLHEALLGCLGG